MAQTPEGAIKCAAARIGVSLDEYLARMAFNQKWCTRCKSWHDKSFFVTDKSRYGYENFRGPDDA